MKLLIYDMGAYTQNDIGETIQNMGIEYRNILYKMSNIYEDTYFKKCISEWINREKYDAVFSVNYFPALAEICRIFQIPYLSWSYDSPLNIERIEETLGYETNYVFFFDYMECQKYWHMGYQNVYHMPLAVNTERLQKVTCSFEERKRYSHDIAMVGQLYESLFQALILPLTEYDKGYLSALLETQMRLYGSNILNEMIDEEIAERINMAYGAIGQTAEQITRDGLIVAMSKEITHMERMMILDVLSETMDVHLYGPGTNQQLKRVKWHGSATYFDSMPKIFKNSKMNLNITLKCIESGIPLRVLDVLGCEGFLISNYQQELTDYFEDGKDIVMYTSMADAIEKCHYYLKNEKERKIIAHRGHMKVKEQFRYQDRLSVIFQTAGLSV